MGARWCEAAGPGWPLRLLLPECGSTHRSEHGATALALVQAALDDRELQSPGAPARAVALELGERRLGASSLAAIQAQLAARGHTLVQVVSSNPLTRVAAAALGLAGTPPTPGAAAGGDDQERSDRTTSPLTLHRGTVRAGDQLEAAGSLLVLGDVNPGGRLRAGGHVLVWGRLRGVAHAGCRGDTDARIVALQLQPLQLRIADVVARGPQEPPPAGLAEEARLVDGAIRIEAARPSWPLSD